MENPYIKQRLEGIQSQLIGAHQGGSVLSSATKGAERDYFVNTFLNQVIPQPFRFGTGDITDQNGRRSGQLDIVIELPFLPSLPLVGGGPRLYLADGIAAVIEVKSSLSSQWDEVESAAKKLKELERNPRGFSMYTGPTPPLKVPFFAVGYTGWSDVKTLQGKLQNENIDGLLVIEKGLFVSNKYFESIDVTGSWALWGLIQCIHTAVSTLKMSSVSPFDYAR